MGREREEWMRCDARGLRGVLALEDCIRVGPWRAGLDFTAPMPAPDDTWQECPCFAFHIEPTSWQETAPASVRERVPTSDELVSSVAQTPRPGWIAVTHQDFDVRVLEESAVLASSQENGEGLCCGPRKAVLAWLARQGHASQNVLLEEVSGWTLMAIGLDGLRLYAHSRVEQGHGSWSEAFSRAGVDTEALLARQGADLFQFLDFLPVGPLDVEITDEWTWLFLTPTENGSYKGVLDYSPSALEEDVTPP
jgi:hypothetical protein